MTKLRDLPLLAILQVEKLLLHERHNAQRTKPIADDIQSSGILRNPPVVVPLGDGTRRYMVLDGANRTTAIRSLGVPHIVAQVVDADDPGLDLTPWCHVVWGASHQDLLDDLQSIQGVTFQPSQDEDVQEHLLDIHTLAVFCTPDGQVYDLNTPHHKLLPRVQALNTIVDCYQEKAQTDRTRVTEMETLEKFYPDLTGIVMLPKYRIDQILYVVGEGHLMPPGSTRFTVSPRVLRLNYPLEELEADRSLEEKNTTLNELTQERLSEKRVRYYAESTFLFDE